MWVWTHVFWPSYSLWNKTPLTTVLCFFLVLWSAPVVWWVTVQWVQQLTNVLPVTPKTFHKLPPGKENKLHTLNASKYSQHRQTVKEMKIIFRQHLCTALVGESMCVSCWMHWWLAECLWMLCYFRLFVCLMSVLGLVKKIYIMYAKVKILQNCVCFCIGAFFFCRFVFSCSVVTSPCSISQAMLDCQT